VGNQKVWLTEDERVDVTPSDVNGNIFSVVAI
jgi:hypothetical protein